MEQNHEQNASIYSAMGDGAERLTLLDGGGIEFERAEHRKVIARPCTARHEQVKIRLGVLWPTADDRLDLAQAPTPREENKVLVGDHELARLLRLALEACA